MWLAWWGADGVSSVVRRAVADAPDPTYPPDRWWGPKKDSIRARSVELARPQNGSCGSVGREQRVEFAPEPRVEPALAVDGPGDPGTGVGRLDAVREP
jgi:hypothetical protein